MVFEPQRTEGELRVGLSVFHNIQVGEGKTYDKKTRKHDFNAVENGYNRRHSTSRRRLRRVL